MAINRQPDYGELMRLLGRLLELAKHSPICAEERDAENYCDCGLDEAEAVFNEWTKRR